MLKGTGDSGTTAPSVPIIGSFSLDKHLGKMDMVNSLAKGPVDGMLVLAPCEG